MTQNWIEVRIESSVDSGELLDQLDDPAVTGPWQESAGMFQHHLDRGGRLLLSGVLPEHQAEISDAFAAAGGVVQHARECDGWLAA